MEEVVIYYNQFCVLPIQVELAVMNTLVKINSEALSLYHGQEKILAANDMFEWIFIAHNKRM